MKVTRREFDTFEQLIAFIDGVEFVNDSAITVERDKNTLTPTAIITDMDAGDDEEDKQ